MSANDDTRSVLTARSARLPADREHGVGSQAARHTRRSLVKTAFWSSLATVLGGLGLGFANFIWPRKVEGFGRLFTVPAARVPAPGEPPRHIPEGKFYLVNLDAGGGVPEPFRGFAAPAERGGILALHQKCPHLGCVVPWRSDFEFQGIRGWFRCPCHQSTYTKAGVRVFGPAPRPMDTMTVQVNHDGSVTVNTSDIHPGAPDNPQRTVPA